MRFVWIYYVNMNKQVNINCDYSLWEDGRFSFSKYFMYFKKSLT